MSEQTYSLKIATLADDTCELEVLVEDDDLTLAEVTGLVSHAIANAPKPADAEAALAFDITIVRDDETPNGG